MPPGLMQAATKPVSPAPPSAARRAATKAIPREEWRMVDFSDVDLSSRLLLRALQSIPPFFST